MIQRIQPLMAILLVLASTPLTPASADDSLCHDIAGDTCDTVLDASDEACRQLLAAQTCDGAKDTLGTKCADLAPADACQQTDLVHKAAYLPNCSIRPTRDVADCGTTVHEIAHATSFQPQDLAEVATSGRVVVAKYQYYEGYTVHVWQADAPEEPTAVEIPTEYVSWRALDATGDRLLVLDDDGDWTTFVLRLSSYDVLTGDLVWRLTWSGDAGSDLHLPVLADDGDIVLALSLLDSGVETKHLLRISQDGDVIFDAPHFLRPLAASDGVVVTVLDGGRCRFCTSYSGIYTFDGTTGAESASFLVPRGNYGWVRDVVIDEDRDRIITGMTYATVSCVWLCSYTYGVQALAHTLAGDTAWSTPRHGYPDAAGGALDLEDDVVWLFERDYPYSVWHGHSVVTGAAMGERYEFEGPTPQTGGPSGAYTYHFSTVVDDAGEAHFVIEARDAEGDTKWESDYPYRFRYALDYTVHAAPETKGFVVLQEVRTEDGGLGLRSIHFPYLLLDSDEEIAPGVPMPNAG